jgi:hypothetical protein
LAQQLFPKECKYELNETDFLAFAIQFRPATNSMGGMANHVDESIITFSITSPSLSLHLPSISW